MFQRVKRLPGRTLVGLKSGILAILAACAAFSSAQAEPKIVTIFTGAGSGVYYYAGGTICGLINARRWTHEIRCVTRESRGSLDNLQALRSGDATFAIVQSDWQFHAVNGTSTFESRGPDRSLRSVMALFPETFTVLARADSGIAMLSNLKGKRVNIGPRGSGSRATMEAVMSELEWGIEDFGHLDDLGTGEIANALCSGDIDAAVLVIAHPNLAVEDILSACDIVLVPVDNQIVGRLAEAQPYYIAHDIPEGAYSGLSSEIGGFALAATLVTTSGTSPAVVREVASAVMDSVEKFRLRHAAFAEFERGQMLSEGLSAPLHSAARRYYLGSGLLTP